MARRKPTAVVATQLRIRESLRRRLEQEAKRRGVSLNFEMADRLARSFETENVRALDAVRADLERLADQQANLLSAVQATIESLRDGSGRRLDPTSLSVPELFLHILPPQLVVAGVPPNVASDIEAMIRGAIERARAEAPRNSEKVDK